MASVHHFQVSTINLNHRVNQFQRQFGFKVLGHSTAEGNSSKSGQEVSTEEREGVALFINSVVMVIRGVNEGEAVNDWISDVVLRTSSSSQYERILKRVQSSSDDILKTTSHHSHCSTDEPHPPAEALCADDDVDSTDSCDSVLGTKEMKYFRVSTPFRAVDHTVFNGVCDCKDSIKEEGSISCLPGFIRCPALYRKSCSLCSGRFESLLAVVPREISHVDHVTFACHTHSSDDILKWYERNLGFQRLKINASEDDAGFILEGSNGMRMLAMQYWQCSETSLTLCKEGDDEKPVQLVFAEPLPNAGQNQVGTFLKENSGPGVQHIAFHTENIVGAVSCLRSNGVHFITPPPEYYLLFEKVSEIKRAGENVELLQQNNILLDFEEDEDKTKYLMQVFSHPLFDRDTFFLEIIQRCGANGFGAGNIAALWKALEIHFRRNNTIASHSGY